MPDPSKLTGTENNGMVFSTARTRAALLHPSSYIPESPPTFTDSDASLVKYRQSGGIDNPYGRGLDAYEPHTVILDQYADAWNKVQDSKAQEKLDAAQAAVTVVNPTGGSGAGGAGGPSFQADGRVASFVNAAMSSLGKPYVWGGTNLATGTDCSGLIYAAARSAGIQLNGQDWPRLRAVDYRNMGAEVSLQDARAGDLVYFDNPGDTDHIGIYLGNGRMLQSPQTGDVTKISTVGHYTSIRRVFDDNAFAQTALPGGQYAWSYNGTTYQPWRGGSVSPNTYNPTPVQTTISRRYGGSSGRFGGTFA